MRHQVQGRKLSRRREHRTLMLANLASSLILTGKIKTTDAKAKEVRPFVERLVTFARRGDLHARRIVLSRLRNAGAVKKLFDEIAPKFADRFGGYTRIIKLGFRHGDNSPVSLIEFVSAEEPKKTVKRKKKATRKTPKEVVKEPVKAEEKAVEPEEEASGEIAGETPEADTAPAEADGSEQPAEEPAEESSGEEPKAGEEKS
ncbi:50S ribosomal protein L17 [Candidatus Latescibacterota bacterium]